MIGAIDIGSNGTRLLIVEPKGSEFNKINFVRLPLRLGFDVFENGWISQEKIEKIVTAMQSFMSLLKFYDVQLFKACATSAMRDSKNGKEIVELVLKQTGIKIHIINGDEEADLVHKTHIAENMDKEHAYFYINVGGGSTDLIFYVDGKVLYKKSINIGTIRILKNAVKKEHWESLKKELKTNIKAKLPCVAIGSGGNINKIFSMSKKKEGKPLSLDLLKNYYLDLSSVSVEERIQQYHLREDRADVIVPALQIFINLMRWTNIQEIYVPQIGLVNGLVYSLRETTK